MCVGACGTLPASNCPVVATGYGIGCGVSLASGCSICKIMALRQVNRLKFATSIGSAFDVGLITTLASFPC